MVEVAARAKKMILIGLDSAIPTFIKKFATEGRLTHIARLMRQGFFTEVFPCPPCDTPTNWTTIVTGSWPGTHGVTSFHTRLPGTSLKDNIQGTDNTQLCPAEFLWDVAEREGKKCFIFDYPNSWPPTIKNGIVWCGWWLMKGKGPGAGLAGEFERELKATPYMYPERLIPEIEKELGPPMTVTAEVKVGEEEAPPEEILIRRSRVRYNYFADLAKFLKEREKWDILICHLHALDSLNHSPLFNMLWSGHPQYRESRCERAWEVSARLYQLLDEIIGRVVNECGDEETLTVVVSDHGCLPNSKVVWIGNALKRAGLLAYKKDPETGSISVDWSKTKAAFFFSPPEYIWVNLKGREPDGIVEPSEYDEVREEIIKALYSIRDPETGECPVTLALRKEEAEFLGHWGDRCGDVVFFVKAQYRIPNFNYEKLFPSAQKALENLLSIGDVEPLNPRIGGTHYGHLPSSTLSPCTNKAFLLMQGPGVVQGYERSKPIWMVDIAPTLTHFLNIPRLRQAEGSIIQDAIG